LSGEDLADLGTRALLEGYRAGRFTPSDTMEAVIARIGAWEASLCALYAFDALAARAAAALSTQRWAGGTPIGVLDGVPATVKELIATRGTPIPLGSAASELVPAAQDAPPAARLREAGAIIFAKTTTPDYGMLSSGLSSFHPLSRNPWNLEKNPGGSSAGAGAAAAGGYGPLHVGTDIGGSIRLPAAWCGLVGFKPSLGRIPIDPYYTGRCAGPMTRSVDDAAWMMQVLSLPDSRDATSLPVQDIDWHACIESPKGLRIGLMLDAGCGLKLDPQIEAAVQAAAGRFGQAGAVIVPVQPVMTRKILDGIDIYWRARLWSEIGAFPADRRDRILPYILDWAEKGAAVTGSEAIAGFSGTFDLRRACARLFDDVDVVLSPTTPNISFPAEWASPMNDPARPFDHICYTLPWNMSEQPAISLNCGFSSDGMPIGVQIITRRFCDWQALALARWYENLQGPIPRWPKP
jgi:Asp-tRNA(Asn)/Glu-tRNA(Gln) amidotransferase A subunit family amidase